MLWSGTDKVIWGFKDEAVSLAVRLLKWLHLEELVRFQNSKGEGHILGSEVGEEARAYSGNKW